MKKLLIKLKTRIFFFNLFKQNRKLNTRKNIALITQFFPPDYAATGQLLDDLTKRTSLKYKVNFEIYTGMPSYAFERY